MVTPALKAQMEEVGEGLGGWVWTSTEHQVCSSHSSKTERERQRAASSD